MPPHTIAFLHSTHAAQSVKHAVRKTPPVLYIPHNTAVIVHSLKDLETAEQRFMNLPASSLPQCSWTSSFTN